MKNYKQLSLSERKQLEEYRKTDLTQKHIAEIMGRSPATISRELRRNSGRKKYNSDSAQGQSDVRRAAAYKQVKVTPKIRSLIIKLANKNYKVSEIAEYLTSKENVSLHVDTIYRTINLDR